jgi:hypothetical protein
VGKVILGQRERFRLPECRGTRHGDQRKPRYAVRRGKWPRMAMAQGPASSDAEEVQNGPMTHSPQIARCCGSRVQVVALSDDGPSRSAVELVRCSDCGTSSWLLDGREVDKAEALGALSRVFAPATPHPKHTPVRQRPARAAAEPQKDLSTLLAGWQVLGS